VEIRENASKIPFFLDDFESKTSKHQQNLGILLNNLIFELNQKGNEINLQVPLSCVVDYKQFRFHVEEKFDFVEIPESNEEEISEWICVLCGVLNIKPKHIRL